jgi:hypothetical protein
MKRDKSLVAERLVRVKELREDSDDLGLEVLGSFGVTAPEIALAVQCSERQVQNWIKKGFLSPLACRGEDKVYAIDEVVQLWN